MAVIPAILKCCVKGYGCYPSNIEMLCQFKDFDMAVIPANVSLKTEDTKYIGHFCCSKKTFNARSLQPY